MEARRLYAPALWLVPDDQTHYPCLLSATAMLIAKQTTSYTRLSQKHAWFVILVSVSIIRLKLTICTSRMDCASPEPRLLWVLRVPKDSPQGCGVHWRRVESVRAMDDGLGETNGHRGYVP